MYFWCFDEMSSRRNGSAPNFLFVKPVFGLNKKWFDCIIKSVLFYCLKRSSLLDGPDYTKNCALIYNVLNLAPFWVIAYKLKIPKSVIAILVLTFGVRSLGICGNVFNICLRQVWLIRM